MDWKLFALAFAAVLLCVRGVLAAPPTDAQRCEADIQLASAKFAQCRLNAESKFSKSGDAAKRTNSLATCSTRLGGAFTRAVARYGAGYCTGIGAAEFDEYLAQCTDDVAEAAMVGGPLPDYTGDLATCSAALSSTQSSFADCTGELSTCSGELATAQADLSVCTADLDSCGGDLSACQEVLGACQAGTLGKLPATGQTTCWNYPITVVPCPGTGHDGEIQAGSTLAYVDNGDGTITDLNTGLMWEKLSDDGSIHDKDDTYDWAGAFAIKVATLNSTTFAGHSDWRLPNVKELQSIVNFEIEYPGPTVSAAFNTGCATSCTVLTCSCTALNYWSSSSLVGTPAAWYVHFFDGHTDALNKTDSPGYVRAVRAGS